MSHKLVLDIRNDYITAFLAVFLVYDYLNYPCSTDGAKNAATRQRFNLYQ